MDTGNILHGGHCDGHCSCCHGTDKKLTGEELEDLGKGSSDTRSIYLIRNMDCPMEEQLIRKKLSGMKEVKGLEFNLLQHVLTVEHLPGTAEAIEKALRSIDMIPERLGNRRVKQEAAKIPWAKIVWAVILAAISEAFELAHEWHYLPDSSFYNFLPAIFAVASICLAGLDTYKKGITAIRNFNLNMNALMSVAVSGAVLIGQFPEAAMVMALFNVSEAIEARALDSARNAVSALLALAPNVASVQDRDGHWQEQDINDIAVGSIARVLPGQKIALDGQVVSGSSAVNQAPITGESMPVEKKIGDPVFAGTINLEGVLEYRTTALANDTTLARIIHAVEDAQSSRAPMQRFVDVFARYYTPAIFAVAIIWAIVPPLLFAVPWLKAIYTALVILVIGCPCALVISTPVTVVSGMAGAAREGILIKGGLYLEQGRRINWLGLDKTGTITSGKPRIVNVQLTGQMANGEVAALAASLCALSDHPVSGAIARWAGKQAEQADKVVDFSAVPGQGILGKIAGRQYGLGNYELVCALGHASSQTKEQIEHLQADGATVTALIAPEGVVALFAAADEARVHSKEAVEMLKAMHVKTVMLSGDNAASAEAIARNVGVDEYRANMLPGQKLDMVDQAREQGFFTGMVGDGINDSPALAKAAIGIAMGACGTDTAIETANVAIMDDDLRKVPRFMAISKAVQAILVQNISLALTIKAAFFIFTIAGYASMWMAVCADVGAALLVVFNGLRAAKV